MRDDSQNRQIVDGILHDLIIPNHHDAFPFKVALDYVSRAFSVAGNTGWHGDQIIDCDQNEALELYGDLSAIPDLLLEARGEEGLDTAVSLESELIEVGKQLVFDQNTLEM